MNEEIQYILNDPNAIYDTSLITMVLVTVSISIMKFFGLLPAVFYKFPEMSSLYYTGNTEGLSLILIGLEIIGFTINTLYHYKCEYNPVTYIESPMILAQLYILALATLKKRRMFGVLYVTHCITTYIVVFVAFTTEYFEKENLRTLIPAVAPLLGITKLFVIVDMVDAEDADQVSLTYWSISLGANFSRMITSFAILTDSYLVISYGVSMMLDLCVLSTALFFQTRPPLDLRPFRI